LSCLKPVWPIWSFLGWGGLIAQPLLPDDVHLILVPDREEALERALGEAPELFVDNQQAAQGDRPSLSGAVRIGRDGRGGA
jgi:hypothetical protein